MAKPASLKPVVQKLELDLDEGATRVHKFPKELIHRLREQEAAKPSSPPADDRTAVFRAPPELLARAMRARLSAQGGDDAAAAAEAAKLNDLPTKPPPAGADDQIADSGVQYMSENTSGISLRPAGLGGFAAVPAARAALGEIDSSGAEPPTGDAGAEASDDGWRFPEPAIDDPTLIRTERLDLSAPQALAARLAEESAPISLVESDPATEALLNTDVDALLAPPAAPAPSFGFVASEPAPTTGLAAPEPSVDVLEPSLDASTAGQTASNRTVLAAVIVLVAVAVFVCLALALNTH